MVNDRNEHYSPVTWQRCQNAVFAHLNLLKRHIFVRFLYEKSRNNVGY